MNQSPANSKFGIKNAHLLVGTLADDRITLAEWTGLEPATPGVTGRYSNQLNYHSKLALQILLFQHAMKLHTDLASPRGFEPL